MTEDRASTRRVVLGVGTALVVLVLLATVVPHVVGWPRSAIRVPVVPTPVESFEAAGPAAEFPEPPAGCPTPIIEAGAHVTVEWEPVVVARSREYAGEPRRGLTAGAEVVTVRCDIVEITAGGQAFVPKPWPDGSSTVLTAGTVVTEVAGYPAACFLMADQDTGWLFHAVDGTGGTPADCEGVPGP